jgi:hypothetical protein
MSARSWATAARSGLAETRRVYDIRHVKTVTFDEAQAGFERVFQLAAAGETVVIHRNGQRVALRSLSNEAEPEVAPRNFFANDYSPEEISELNTLASQAPRGPLP